MPCSVGSCSLFPHPPKKQRVAIARALITHPDIVLADEPTANLDSVAGDQILELMKEMNRIEKTTFIFSTHDVNVLKYAKDIIKIKDCKEESYNNQPQIIISDLEVTKETIY